MWSDSAEKTRLGDVKIALVGQLLEIEKGQDAGAAGVDLGSRGHWPTGPLEKPELYLVELGPAPP